MKSPLTQSVPVDTTIPPSIDNDTIPEEEPARGRPMSTTKDKGNVVVSVRVKPEGAANENNQASGEWMIDGRQSLVSYRGREGGDYYYGRVPTSADFRFLLTSADNVFAQHDNNVKVYETCAKRLVRRVMEGYHGTVFAYGMTGTGKTFSMQGTANSPGMIPRAITDIFSFIRETPQREFLLRVSYLEIYNEKIHDLLAAPVNQPGPMQQQEEIKLREDSKRGVYATPLKEEIVQSPTQLLRVIARGDHARRTSSTQYNVRSSRSHAVVQIVVESRERFHGDPSSQEGKRAAVAPGAVRVSTLSLIDLAGSERAAENKERRAEGAHINKSLLTLGNVVSRLSGNRDKSGQPMDKDGKHLPYRDSKLTRLLQGALSGNSLISILCTIQLGSAGSTAAIGSHTGENINTLKFAARAKNNIVSHAKKAEEAFGNLGDAGSRALLDRYRLEIQDLRKQLDHQKEEGDKGDKPKHQEEQKAQEVEKQERHDEQLLEIQLARTALKERIDHLNRLILSSKSIGVNSNRNFSSLNLNQQQRSSGFSSASRAQSIRSTASAFDLKDESRRASGGSVATATTEKQSKESPDGVQVSTPDEDEDEAGEMGDGNASLTAQVRNLQGDLADKNRYISTLEKRLMQARRASRSRLSAQFDKSKPSPPIPEDESVDAVIKEKDAEIADLRARLDDKDRMLAALRSAARKRDVADSRPNSSLPTNERSSMGSIDTIANAPTNRRSSGQSFTSVNGSNKRSSLSGTAPTESRTKASSPPSESTAQTRNPSSPVGRLMQLAGGSEQREVKRTHGVDDMTRMLDQMIQRKVESAGGTLPSQRLHSQQHSQTSNSSNGASAPDAKGIVNGVTDSTSQPQKQIQAPTSKPPSAFPSPSSSNAGVSRPRRGLSNTEDARLSGWESEVTRRRSQRKGDNGTSASSASTPSRTDSPSQGLTRKDSGVLPSGVAPGAFLSQQPLMGKEIPGYNISGGVSSPSTTMGSSTIAVPLSGSARHTPRQSGGDERPITAIPPLPNVQSENSGIGTAIGSYHHAIGSHHAAGSSGSGAGFLSVANVGRLGRGERDESPARSDGTAIADEMQEGDARSEARGVRVGVGGEVK